MGLSLSYFACYPLASIIQSNLGDVSALLLAYEKDNSMFNSLDYSITIQNLVVLCERNRWNPSDIDILCNYYVLVDKRGSQSVSVIEVLVTFSMLICRDKRSCLEFSFELFDRKKSGFIEKERIIQLFELLNETCSYCGDKKLPKEQIVDFVNSLFISSGKLDGDIFYGNYYEAIIDHPIVEMFCSLQFQGVWQDKVVDERNLVKGRPVR